MGSDDAAADLTFLIKTHPNFVGISWKRISGKRNDLLRRPYECSPFCTVEGIVVKYNMQLNKIYFYKTQLSPLSFQKSHFEKILNSFDWF